MDLVLVLAGVALAQLAAVISPGPSLLVVARVSIATSRSAGAWTAVGLGVGSVIWAAAALFGLQAAFATLPWLYTVMKVAGALYLFYLAIMLWRHARTPIDIGGKSGQGAMSRRAAVRRGLLTQLANPKVAVFFGSIFVTLLPPQPSPAFYAVLLPLVFLVEAAWYVFVAHALSTERLRRRYARLKAAIDRITGTVLAGLGAKLIADG